MLTREILAANAQLSGLTEEQIKAIIMLLILLISLCAPVMAADADTSSTSIDSTISYSEGNKEPQFLLPLDPESQLRLKFELGCAAIIAICTIVAVVSAIKIIQIKNSQVAKKQSTLRLDSKHSHKYKQ